MKKNLITIILIALVFLNIIDGDFANPSWLDYFKLALIALGIALSLIPGRSKADV